LSLTLSLLKGGGWRVGGEGRGGEREQKKCGGVIEAIDRNGTFLSYNQLLCTVYRQEAL
jgi:hypothetical protein